MKQKEYAIAICETSIYLDTPQNGHSGCLQNINNRLSLYMNGASANCYAPEYFFDTLSDARKFIEDNSLDDIVVDVAYKKLSTDFLQEYIILNYTEDYGYEPTQEMQDGETICANIIINYNNEDEK